MFKQAGTTLIELMVAVAIVGVLATLAVPSYSNYRLKSNRPIGSSCLVEAQRRIENAYAHLNRYPGCDLTSYGYASTPVSCGDQPIYSISLTFPNSADCKQAGSYLLTATAQGSQAKDGNLLLTYDLTKTDPGLRLLRQHLAPGTSTPLLDSWDFQPGH